jgi:uncharacterized protein YdaU (DUF1376 family)
LSLAEDGAFNRLLRLCWRTPGCSVPADRAWVYRRLRAHTEADQAIIETILTEFFREADGRLSNARLTKEWLAANEAHTRRKSAGAKGGKAKALKTNETALSNATPMLKQPEPEPEPEEVTTANAVVAHTPQDPPESKSTGRARGAARGNRIAPNWAPTITDYAFASSEGMTREDINREADKFRDYWTAKSGREACELDWSATWRNWVRSDFRKRAGSCSGAGNASRNGSRTDAFDRLAERLQGGPAWPEAGGHDDPGAEGGHIIDITPTRITG